MRRIASAFALLLLLPAMALGVSEGVVEDAPSVAIHIPEMTDALFGAWEQGLDDIRLAARRAAMSWADFPEDMKMEFLQMTNLPVDEDVSNDGINVRFVYRDEENRQRRVLVKYLRGTGQLVRLTETTIETERHGGEPLDESVLLHIAMNQLEKRYHAQKIQLREGDCGEDAERWIGQFDSQQGMYRVCLDRATGEVISISLDVNQ